MSAANLSRASTRSRRNSSTPSVSSDDAAPRSPTNVSLSPVKDHTAAPVTPSAMTNVHREWQKMRYSRRSAASQPESGTASPAERTSPSGTPMALAGGAPRPSFMNWAAQSPLTLPSRPPQTFVSPLAEWALSGHRAPRCE